MVVESQNHFLRLETRFADIQWNCLEEALQDNSNEYQQYMFSVKRISLTKASDCFQIYIWSSAVYLHIESPDIIYTYRT